MANDINVVALVGRLTRESELKYTKGGTSVCKFSMAVNRRRKIGDKWGDEVSFIDIVLWGKTAETLHPYLSKGKQVSVIGCLVQNRWEFEGQSRSKLEVVANAVQLLGGSESKENSQKKDYHTMPRKSYSSPPSDSNDDSPF